jgi:hypothetical protein
MFVLLKWKILLSRKHVNKLKCKLIIWENFDIKLL